MPRRARRSGLLDVLGMVAAMSLYAIPCLTLYAALPIVDAAAKDGGKGGGGSGDGHGGDSGHGGSGSDDGGGDGGGNSGGGSGHGDDGSADGGDDSGNHEGRDDSGHRGRTRNGAVVDRFIDRLRSRGAVASSSISGSSVEIRYTDGWSETAARSGYALRDARRHVVISRPVKQSDFDRLRAAAK